jgi:NADPH:quinone reductase
MAGPEAGNRVYPFIDGSPDAGARHCRHGDNMGTGKRVLVSAFAESPAQALETCVALHDMDRPDPAGLQRGEVLLEVRSAAVTWVDLLMTSGQYQHMPQPPYCPGMEYSGVVAAVGSDVDAARVRVGDRMLADFMQVGPRAQGDYQAAGGFASYAVVPQQALVPIPAGFSFDEACCLLGNYETAYHCLVVRGQLLRGETVLINGASGSTGMAAVQLAKLLGATVIATGRSDDKLAQVRAHGADHVINIRQPDDPAGVRGFRDDVKALTGGRGVDVVYDPVGGATAHESLRCLAFEGRFLIVGWTSTPDVARGKGLRGAPNANQLPTNIMQMKSLTVMGCPAVIAATRKPALRTERLARIMEWVQAGKIRPCVSRRYPIGDFKAAMLARWNADVVGSCVLNP